MYACCYRCGQTSWVIDGSPGMYCSAQCRAADEEIARLNAEIRRLQNLLAGIR